MAQSGGQKLAIETGRAVDPAGTHAHHQIFRMEHRGKYDTLHYSVFYAYSHAMPDLNVPREFVKNARDIKIKNNTDKLDVEKSFLSLLDYLRPSGRNAAFVAGQLCHALTYDLHFAHGGGLTGFAVRPTLAVMTDHISYKQANESDDTELRSWRRAVGAKPHCFEDVTSRTTALIQENLRTAAFKNGMDCVYHILPKDSYTTLTDMRENKGGILHRIGRFLPQYGSVLAGGVKQNRGPQRALVSGKAVRNMSDMFNVTVVSEFLKQGGRNVFSPDIARSFVKYRHALMTWNALNPT